MQIIVIGCGKVGSRLARVLAEEGHDIVIVHNDATAFKALGPGFQGLTVTGVPIDQDVLKHAGIETADALAAVMPDDNVNIIACQIAKEIFNVPKVIARIYNPAREHVFHQFGLDTICPTNITVDVIRSNILGDAGVSNHTIANTDISFKYEKVQKSYEGKKLDTIKVKAGSMVFGVIQDGRFIFANNSISLKKEDILVIAENPD